MLIIFVKLSVLDIGGKPGYASIWCLYVVKSSIILPIQWFSFSNNYTPYKALTLATSATAFLSKIPKHSATWSKSSILVVVAILDLRPFKFEWGEGLKKTSSLNPSKGGRLTKDINWRYLMVKLHMKLFPILQYP